MPHSCIDDVTLCRNEVKVSQLAQWEFSNLGSRTSGSPWRVSPPRFILATESQLHSKCFIYVSSENHLPPTLESEEVRKKWYNILKKLDMTNWIYLKHIGELISQKTLFYVGFLDVSPPSHIWMLKCQPLIVISFSTARVKSVSAAKKVIE